MAIGKVHSARAVFIARVSGDATHPEHGNFELQTNEVRGGAPLIHHVATGQTWSINWSELLDLAIDAGVAVSEEPSHGA